MVPYGESRDCVLLLEKIPLDNCSELRAVWESLEGGICLQRLHRDYEKSLQWAFGQM